MDNQLYVLSELRHQLECIRAFGSFHESNEVIGNILGQLPDHKEKYLRAKRNAFIEKLASATGDAAQYQIEAVIDNLSVFWTDAKEYMHDNADGIGVDGRAWSVIKVYYSEAINYIAQVYYLYLTRPKKEYYQFWEKFPGLEKKAVHHFLIQAGLLGEKRIHELEEAIEGLNHPLHAPSDTISRNPTSISDFGPYWDSLTNLESFINNAIDNLKRKQEIHKLDWEYIDGRNKENFIGLIIYLLKDSAESYYRQTLYIIDRVARLYHEIRLQDMGSSISETAETICTQCENLLESYLGIILLRNQAFPPKFCLYRIIKDLDIDIRVNWQYLMDKMADFNNQSKNLNYKFQAVQCSKCDVEGCYGRYSDQFGPAKYIGAGNKTESVEKVSADEDEDSPEGEPRPMTDEDKRLVKENKESLNLIDPSGVDELDKLFYMQLDDKPVYPKKEFYRDFASFAKKCKGVADGDMPEKKKRAWIVAALNVLSEVFYDFSATENEFLADYALQYIANIDATFMRAIDSICVKQIAQELGLENIFDEEDKYTSEEGEKNRIEMGLDPMTREESLLFEELGPNISYYERQLCRECKIPNCPYRFGKKRFFGDVNYAFGEPGLDIQNQPTPSNNSPEPDIKTDIIAGFDYITDCHDYICSRDVIDFLDAVSLALSIKPKRFMEDVSEDYCKNFINEHIKPRESYIYPHATALEAQLTDEIKARKDDELELSNFIVGFLSPFYEVAVTLYPIGHKEVDVKRRVIFMSASGFVSCPFKDFMQILSDAIVSVVSKTTDSDYVSTVALMSELLDRAPKGDNVPEDRVFSAIHEIITSLSYVEAALESALLKSGIRNDYIYYEEEAGIILGRHISEVELMLVSGLTMHTIASRIKKYGHTTKTGIRPEEDTYDYVRRLFSDDPSSDDDGDRVIVVPGSDGIAITLPQKQTGSGKKERTPVFPPDKVGAIILSETMKSYLRKASAYFKDGRWYNDDKFEYAVFLRAFYKTLFGKEGAFNVYWGKLPVLPLQDGTILTPRKLTDQLRKYQEKVHGGICEDFVKLFKS